MSEPNLPRVFVSIGSNINPEFHLQRALDLLRQRCLIVQVSSVYRSPAFGFSDQPDFLDVIIEISTALTPEQFKAVLFDIEKQLGRDRASQTNKHGPLTMDMDILLWGGHALSYGSKPWQVPDESIVKYAAVAVPLAEIAPEFIHPTEHVTLQSIADRLNSAEIQKIELTLER